MKSYNSKFTIILKVLLFCAIIIGLIKFEFYLFSLNSIISNGLLSAAVQLIIALLTTYIFLQFDKKQFAEIGLQFTSSTIKKFFTGCLVGIITVVILVLGIAYFSGYNIGFNKNANAMFLFLSVSLPVLLLALMEEIIFRSYSLFVLKNTVGIISSLIITSLLFGLYHVAFGWGLEGFVSTTIWGIWFGLFAIYSDGIAMPAGVHFAMNFTQIMLGIANTSYGICNIVNKDGAPVQNFSYLQSAGIILEIVFVIVLSVFTKNKVMKKGQAIN